MMNKESKSWPKKNIFFTWEFKILEFLSIFILIIIKLNKNRSQIQPRHGAFKEEKT
jgi:hypothetical protein